MEGFAHFLKFPNAYNEIILTWVNGIKNFSDDVK